jgi:hypothetical protein
MLKQVVHILTTMLHKVETGDDTVFKVISPDWGKDAGTVIHSPSEV